MIKIVVLGAGIVIYDLYDEYDQVAKTLSIARTPGYTCNAALHLLIKIYLIKRCVSAGISVEKRAMLYKCYTISQIKKCDL